MSALDDLKSMLDVLTDVANTGPKAAAAVKDALSTMGAANPSELLATVTASEDPQSIAGAFLDQLKDDISQNEKLNSLIERRIRLRQEEAKLANAHPATVPTQAKPASTIREVNGVRQIEALSSENEVNLYRRKQIEHAKEQGFLGTATTAPIIIRDYPQQTDGKITLTPSHLKADTINPNTTGSTIVSNDGRAFLYGNRYRSDDFGLLSYDPSVDELLMAVADGVGGNSGSGSRYTAQFFTEAVRTFPRNRSLIAQNLVEHADALPVDSLIQRFIDQITPEDRVDPSTSPLSYVVGPEFFSTARVLAAKQFGERYTLPQFIHSRQQAARTYLLEAGVHADAVEKTVSGMGDLGSSTVTAYRRAPGGDGQLAHEALVIGDSPLFVEGIFGQGEVTASATTTGTRGAPSQMYVTPEGVRLYSTPAAPVRQEKSISSQRPSVIIASDGILDEYALRDGTPDPMAEIKNEFDRVGLFPVASPRVDGALNVSPMVLGRATSSSDDRTIVGIAAERVGERTDFSTGFTEAISARVLPEVNQKYVEEWKQKAQDLIDRSPVAVAALRRSMNRAGDNYTPVRSLADDNIDYSEEEKSAVEAFIAEQGVLRGNHEDFFEDAESFFYKKISKSTNFIEAKPTVTNKSPDAVDTAVTSSTPDTVKVELTVKAEEPPKVESAVTAPTPPKPERATQRRVRKPETVLYPEPVGDGVYEITSLNNTRQDVVDSPVIQRESAVSPILRNSEAEGKGGTTQISRNSRAFTYGGYSHINEDSKAFRNNPNTGSTLIAVADGVGDTEVAGGFASELTTAFLELFPEDLTLTAENLLNFMNTASIQPVLDILSKRAQANSASAGEFAKVFDTRAFRSNPKFALNALLKDSQALPELSQRVMTSRGENATLSDLVAEASTMFREAWQESAELNEDYELDFDKKFSSEYRGHRFSGEQSLGTTTLTAYRRMPSPEDPTQFRHEVLRLGDSPIDIEDTFDPALMALRDPSNNPTTIGIGLDGARITNTFGRTPKNPLVIEQEVVTRRRPMVIIRSDGTDGGNYQAFSGSRETGGVSANSFVSDPAYMDVGTTTSRGIINVSPDAIANAQVKEDDLTLVGLARLERDDHEDYSQGFYEVLPNDPERVDLNNRLALMQSIPTEAKPVVTNKSPDVVDTAVTSSTPDTTKVELTVKAEEPPKVESAVTAPTPPKPERATPKKETTASTPPVPTEPKVTKRAEPVVTPPPSGGGGEPPKKDPPVAYSADPEDDDLDQRLSGFALTSRAVSPFALRSNLGTRPAEIQLTPEKLSETVEQIISLVKKYTELDLSEGSVAHTSFAEVLDAPTFGALRELQSAIAEYQTTSDIPDEGASAETWVGGMTTPRGLSMRKITALFAKLFPTAQPARLSREDSYSAVNDVILPYLREISPDKEAEDYYTTGASDGNIQHVVKQILANVVARAGDGAVPAGEVALDTLEEKGFRQNFSRVLSVLKRLIKRPVVDPRSVKSVDAYLAEQETAATVTPELDLADLISGEGAAKMMGMEGPTSSGSIAPGSMTGALSSREFVPQFVRGIGIRLYRAIDSWKESLKSGSAIEGLGNSEVFPTGFETTLTTALQQLSKQVNAEIEQGMLETRQIGGNEVTLPKTVAGKLSEIVLDTSRMATHSTLIGRLGNKRGPVGALVTGDPIQKFLNLFLASVMQKLRRGEQITGDDVKDFLTQTVTPDQATDEGGNLINGPVAGESVTVAETMATRLVDSLEYHKQKALTQMVATADNPVESGVWRNEVIRLTQEQKVLNQLIKKDEDFEDPSQAAEIRGQLLNQGAPFTREQALAYLFGTNAARQEYNDAAYPITDYASRQMTALTAAGVATPTGYFRPNSKMRRLIDYTQKGHTEAAKGQFVPTLDKQIEEIKNAENAFQEKDQILEAIEQAYGIPFVTSLLNASRVAADDSGTILQGQDLIKGLGGSGYAGRRFESIVGFSSGVGSIANFGIDAVDFARLMTNTDLTDEQMEARDQLALKFPELASLSQDDLKKLAELDLEQNPTDLIRKIFRVLGPKIKVRVDALVRQAAMDAGYSDDDATSWLTTGNNVPQGFENLVGAARLFDSSRSTEQQVEINRAVSLAENLVSQYLQSGDTTATALARLTGNTEMMDTLTPKLAEDAVGSVSAGYSVAAKASDIMADQTGRPQSNIYRRTTVAVRNAERVQKEIDAVNEEIRLLEQAKSKTKSKSKISVIEKDLIAANRRRDSLRLQLRKEQESVPQDRITQRMEQLRSIVSISPNTVEGARAATELAIREATRKITGRYNIEGDEGFGTDSLEDRFRRLVEYTDLENLSSRTPEQQRRFDELQAQRIMRQRQYQGEETQDTIFTVWTPEQQVSTEASDVIRGTSLRPLIQNAREVSSDNEEIPVSNFPVDEMVKLAKEVTPEDFAKYGTEYADLKQEARFLSERIKAFRSATRLAPEQEQQLQADEQRIRAVIARGKELESVMADPDLLPMNAEEEKESQQIEAETNRVELLLKILKDKLLAGQISQEEFDKQSGLLSIDKSINNTRRLELGAARRRRTGSSRLGAVKRIVDIVFDSIEQYSSEMTGGAGGFSLDTNQVIGELMTQVRAEGVREAPAGASSATQRIEAELVKVAKDIVASQNLPDIDASYTDAELKEARDYLASIRGKDSLTPEETRKRSAMKSRLFRQSSVEIATRFKDNKGVLDIADLAVALLPADWQTNDVQADQAYTLAEMLQGLTPIQLAALAKVDITNAYSLAALARNKDPQLQNIAAVISQVNSNTDTSVASRLAFRKGTQRARQAQNVSNSIAAARAQLAEVRGVKDFYFDLETDYSDADPSKRHIAQAAFTDEAGQVDEVFGVATTGQLTRLMQLKKTAKDEAEFVALAMSIFNEDADGNQMAQGPSKAVLQKAAEVAYRSQYLAAHVMTQQEIREMLQQRIKQADRVIGHNIAAFDLPAVYGGTVPKAVSAKVQDTLPMSRRQYIGEHTLSGTYKYVTGQDLSNAHLAGADVAANIEIFKALSTMLTPAEVAELRQLQTEEARLSALELTDAEKKDLKDLEAKAASRKLGKKDQARFDELTARDRESRFGTRLSEEKRQRKRQLEGRPRNDTYARTLDPALQRLMSFGDPTNDPKAAKEMAAAFAYINPLQQMLDFTSRVDESVASGEALDYGADKKTAEINQRIIKNINTMFKSRLQSAYGVDDVRNLDQTQLADFRNTLQQSFIDPNSGLLMDVVDEKTKKVKKSFYPIKAYLQQMLGSAFPTRGQNSGYAQSIPLLERFGSLSSIMAAAGTLGIQADMGKGVSFPSMGGLLTQMLAGTDTSRQAAMVGTTRPRNPAVTSAVRTASVGTGEGGAGFGGGGSGDGGMGDDGRWYGDGEMGGGFRSITIANATIQSMTANSVGITLQGGSIVLNGQAVELSQRGGSYGQNSQFFSKNPALTALSGVTNLLEASRNLAAREMSGQTTTEGKESVRDQAMNDFGQNVAMMFTNNPVFRELTARLSGLSRYGMALPDLGSMADDPLGTLGTLSGFNASLSSTLAERKTELESAGVLTESQQAELDGINQAEEDLKTFSEVIRRLNSELGRTQAALTVRNSYEKSAGVAAKAASTTVSNVSGRRDRFTQASLQAARNVFDQSMGSAGGRYGFEGRAELTRATSDYVLQMMKSSGSVESVIDPATGEATLKTILGFDPAAVGSGVDVSGINAAADMITQELKQFAASTNIESTMASFARLNASLQVARDSLIKMANDDTLDPDVREQAATQLKVLDDATYASSEGGRELERTERALTSQRSKQIQTLRERLQANATENLALGPIDPRRRIREYRMISDFLRTSVNEEGYKELFGTGTLMAVSAKNPKNRINLRDASYEDILATSQRLSEVGSEMSVESLQGLQRAVNESQQQRNQSPYAQSFNWLVNQGQNIQQVGMWAQSLFNLPQTLTGMVQQFAEPQLNVVRTLTSARALSLDASKYSQVLGAASNLQQRFGGTITGQLGQITSFIPLTNTYGVDIDEVVNVARKLAAFDPAQGMEGASIAIKEFLSGNVASLSRRFELNRSSLTKINMGDPQKMLDSLNDLLNGMGITDRLIDEQANSLATKYDKMLGKLDQVYINLSSIAVEQITPYLDQLTNGTDGGLLGIDLSGFARDKVFETMSKQQAAGAADEALIGPNGLDSIDLSGDTAKFAKSVDTVLREANKAMGGVSETYNTVLGTPAQFDAYRLLGNMTGAERVRVQAAAQKNVGAGMTTSQAILQALRDVGGDYNQNQVLMGFRRQLGFYDGVALDAQQQEKLVKTLGQSNFEGWSELTRNFDSVEVLDADTVEVTVKDENGNEKRERLRLAGIDAFEKGTPESDAAIAFVRQALSNKSFSVSSAGLDKYGRTVSMINVDGMNLNAELIRQGMASVGYTDMEGTAFTPEMRAQFEQLQLAAGNAGVGPINKDAAEMGLGALPILSQQAKENVYQQQYGLGNILGGAMGVGSGATIASIVAKMALAGGFTMPAALAPGGASFAGGVAAAAANPTFWLPIIAGAVVGGGALAYTNAKNREAYNADSSLETVRAQYQEQLRLDQEAMNETRANRYAQFYKYEVTDADIANAQRAQIESAGPFEITSIPDYFKLGIYPNTIRPYDPLKVVNEQETKILKAANEKASEAYTNYYNSMTDQQKEVEKMFKINPFSGERERISAIRNQIDTYTVASKESRLAADMLSTYSESITEFTDSTTVLTNNIDTFNNAIASGMRVRIPAIDNEGKLEKIKLTDDVIASVGADTLRSILDQIPKVRMSTYQQEAKNYLDQSMEQQLQLRQARLQNRMDSIGKLSLTAAPLRGAMLASAGTPSYASGAGVGEYYDDMIQGIPTYSEEAILKLLFKVDLEEGQAKSDILDAARQAMKLAQEQLKTFQEQEMLTYMVDLQYGTTMKNFVTAFNMNPKASMDYLSLLGQGNPRFAFDYTDQMMGINPKQMFMQGFTPNMPPIRSAGPGAISFGYTQGPIGQLQMYSDMARSSSMFDMLNMGEQMQIYQGMAQAQGQITMRNIQYGNQMRDLTINHNRTMEDIARNSARQIEGIHRNFAREMKLNQQTNEVNKRAAPPATYERLINASAKIPTEERKRIDQEYVNDRNEANRLGVFNYEMFMKEFQNEDPELAALVAEYQAIDPTDYAAREDFFQNRLRPRVGQLLPTIQQRWETAEGPEKERLGTLITALTADPQRADKFLQAADTKANESLRRAEVKADAERQLKDLKLSEEQIRNQISDQEKNIREKGPTMTEAERRDADLQLRMSKNELTNNLAAQAAANAQIEGVTSTLPLYQDSVKETWNSIVMDSTTALAQLRTNLNEYQITLKQQIEDAELQLGRSKEDVVRQFTDAAVEISQTVPEEFKKGLDAIMAYNSARTQAEILYMSAQNYDTSTPEGATAAANTLANARLVMANGTRAAFGNMGYSESDMNQLVAASTAPYSSVVGRATTEPGNKATRLSEFETGLSKYASPYNRNALQVVIVEGKKPMEVPGETGGNNQEDLSQNGVVIYGPGR